MRGTRVKHSVHKDYLRITPAHAGNTCEQNKERARNKDHPRPCGEHITTLLSTNITAGSPPPMRGTHRIVQPKITNIRITPAHAGNTRWWFSPIPPSQDHPRPCGEHGICKHRLITWVGSPPPMRGTLPIVVIKSAWHRITPAHAGNTT